jgi:DNA-binding transcriptional MerR regulator
MDSHELETGVTTSRLAELAGTTTRNANLFAQMGALESIVVDGKKRFGQAAFERLEQILALQAEGLALEVILKRFGIDPKQAAENLRTELESLKTTLDASRAKLEEMTAKLGSREVRRVNELLLTKKELAELEQLRQSNLRRAQLVEQRAKAVKMQLEYQQASMGVTRMALPQAPRKSKKPLN